MYELDPEEFRPPAEILSQCIQVLIVDDKLKARPVDIKRWCFENCKSFVYMDETDVSDVSLQWDYIYAFYFGEQEDANWFSLRWL
jgi:hypothetical protein